jgi:rhodanese-related sulfurtransferase
MGRAMSAMMTVLTVTITLYGQEASETNSQELKVPESKQTKLGLYVTARQAYEKWKADPDGVKILDVRTPEEYVFVGHAEMARNIPYAFFVHAWNAEKNAPVMRPNPDFVERVKEHYGPDDTILITCRSGGRSKKSVDMLAEAGFKNVYNIIDGMEGDEVKEADSLFVGKRVKNGWKNSGIPWTYKLDPQLMYLDQQE